MVRPLEACATYIRVSIVVGFARRLGASGSRRGVKVGSYCTPGRKSPTQWLLWELAHPWPSPTMGEMNLQGYYVWNAVD